MSLHLPRGAVFLAILALSPAVHAIDFPWNLSLDLTRDKADPRDAGFTGFSVGERGDALAWGDPLEGGAIRVLVAAPRFTLGDVKALAQQLELKPEVVAFWDSTHIGAPEGSPVIAGTSTDETLARWREFMGKDVDVIILANLEAGLLPDDDLKALTEKVRGGTGLVLAHDRQNLTPQFKAFLAELRPADDAADLTRGIGEGLTPEWSGGLGFVQGSLLGQGRVVELDFPGPRPRTHCLIPGLKSPLEAEPEYFDSYLSLVARAVCWAAGRHPKSVIDSVEPLPVASPDASEIPVGLTARIEGDALDQQRQQLIQPYTVHLREPASDTLTVRTRLRLPGRGTPVISEAQKPLRKGDSTFRVYTVAGAGKYYLDVWLLEKGRVVDWYTEPVTLDVWPAIGNLTANKPFVLSQDSLGLTFTVSPQPRPFTVLARAVDTFGRVVAQTNHQVAPNVSIAQVGLDLADLISGELKAEVFAADRDVPALTEWDTRYAAYACLYVPVRLSADPHSFSLVVKMDGSAEYNARNAYSVLARHGIAGADTAGTEEAAAYLSEAGLEPFAHVAQYTPKEVKDGTIRVPCLNEPKWREQDAEHVKVVTQAILYTGTSMVSLGTGNCLSESNEPVCQSPDTLSAYYEFLRKAYGSLESMNASWGTTFGRWESITPPPEAAATKLQVYAPWVDFRTFMDSVFTDTHVTARGLVRALDNRSRVGFEARPQSTVYTGYDWSELGTRLDWVTIPLDERLADATRCFRGPETLTGLSVPTALSDRDAAPARWYPWFAVLHGMQMLWLPRVLGGSDAVPPAPLIGPSGDWIPQAPELFAAADQLRGGIADLLLSARRENSGVAVYFSQASQYLNQVEPSFGVSTPGAESAFTGLLRDLGYSYDFVSPEQARRGALNNYKVLILPMARALSDAEVAAIRTFAGRGGSLVADVAPGEFNEHGVRRPAPPLDDLFGVRHAKPPKAAAPADALVQLVLKKAPVSAAFTSVTADQGVEATGAAVGGLAGVTPVWLMRQGASLSVLTNHPLQSGDAGSSSRASLRTLFSALLAEGGATPAAEVSQRDGQAWRGEVAGYTWGNMRLVALLADPDAGEQKLRVALPDSASVYDVLAGTRVLRARTVTLDLAPGQAALYACLPYDVTGFSLDSVPSVHAGQRLPFTLKVEARKGTPAVHLVHMELISLNSSPIAAIPWYSRDVVCEGGRGEGFVRLALNEHPGVYRLRARDVATGLTAEAVVKVLDAQ